MNITIREVKAEDVEEIFRINAKSFTTDRWSRDAIKRELSLSYSRGYVVECNGKIAAYSFVWILQKEAVIMTFAVAPEFRRKGVGKLLLKHIIESLPKQVTSISLDVRKSNIPAIRLYRSAGFRIVNERPKFYSDKETALFMELRLDKIEQYDRGKREKNYEIDRQ